MVRTSEYCKFAITESKCEKERKRCSGVTCRFFELRMESEKL
jgi:hypothetical protein